MIRTALRAAIPLVGGSLLSDFCEERSTLRYRLIFKHPEAQQPVASMDFAEADGSAALARLLRVAGHLHAELWQGETCLGSLTPGAARDTAARASA